MDIITLFFIRDDTDCFHLSNNTKYLKNVIASLRHTKMAVSVWGCWDPIEYITSNKLYNIQYKYWTDLNHIKSSY